MSYGDHLNVNFMLRTDLLPAYVKLLCDNEAEVRIAAAGKVTKFCQILEPQLAIQHVLPCVKVQKCCGTCLLPLLPYLLLFVYVKIYCVESYFLIMLYIFRTYQLILLSMFAPLWHQ